MARPAQEEVLDDVEQCGAGGVLARPAQEELGVAAFSSGGADPLRGGAGGSSATRRKRTEKMLASLTELLNGWAESEGETAEETATEDDGSYDVLFTQLEQLIWQRPADPVGALAALLQEWQAPPRTVQVAPRWASSRRSSDDWHDEWTSWAEWDNHWSQDAPRGRWSRKALASWEGNAIDDGDDADAGWTEVTHRKRRQKDKQPGAQKPKQPEVAVARGQPAKGKGKGRGAAGDRDSLSGAGGDAGAMRAADWCPRAADWNAGTVVVSTVDEMWEDLTLDYVMCPRSDGELDRLRTLVLSSESPPDVTIVLLKGDAELEKGRKEFAEVEWAEARVPGTWRGHIRVASAWMAKCSPDAPSLRQPTIQPKAPVAQATCVLRVHADWVYCERGAKAWAEITKNPGAHFRAWAAASFGSINDTWKWQLTRGQGGAEATVEGLIRMPMARAAAALSASGQRHAGETWFVSNVSRNQEIAGVPELAVHWQEWEPAEEWSAYLARCRRASQAADFGLARGAKQLGIRRVASEEDLAKPRTVRRLWRACGVPRSWSFDEISEFLVECHFVEPVVEERMPWRGATAWSFRATMPADADFFVFHVGEDTIELTRVGKDSRRHSDRALPLEVKQVFGAGRKQRKSVKSEPPKRFVTVTASQDAAAGSDATNDMSIDGGSDRPRLDDGKSLPTAADDAASKRPRTTVVVNDAGPQVPGGLKLVQNAGGGNCLFLSVAEALCAQGRSRRSSNDLRNLCVTHLRRHSDTYRGFWKGDSPDEHQHDISHLGFDEYLKRIGRDGAWGGSIELAGLAATLNQQIFVIRPFKNDFDIRVFGAPSKSTPLALWFADRHYQALVGSTAEVAGQATKAEIGDPADRGGAPSAGRATSSLGGRTASLGGRSALSSLGGATQAAAVSRRSAASSIGGCTARPTGATTGAPHADVPRAASGSSSKRARDDDASDLDEPSQAIGPSQRALLQPRYRRNVLVTDGGPPRFVCPHCDYAYTHASRTVVSSARRAHLVRWHDGDGLPGSVKVVDTPFRRLTAAEVKADSYDWKCPVCRFGIPAQARHSISKHVFEREKTKHRQDRHPSFDDRQWQALAASQAMRRRSTGGAVWFARPTSGP